MTPPSPDPSAPRAFRRTAHSIRSRSKADASEIRADSRRQCARSTECTRFAGMEFCHSPVRRRISCGTSQSETVDAVQRRERGWWGTKMIPTVGIIPVSLHLLRWNQNVFPVLPAPRIDVAIDILHIGRITVGTVAAAQRRIVRHMPGRIEFFMQRLVLVWMLAMSGTLSRLLRLDARNETEENGREEQLAKTV